jgi:hypothetical protein
MTYLFKFLSSQHIDRIVCDGTIRVSSLSHFRTLEGNKWIADPNEGSRVVNVISAPHGNEGPEPYGEPWRPTGYPACVEVSGGAKLIFNNIQFSYSHPECFIFCMSFGSLETLTQAMCRDAEEPYDACVRIVVHPDILAHRILHKGTIIELDNRPVTHFFAQAQAKLVTYDWVLSQPSAGPAPAPDPFQKEAFFEEQSEYRVVLYPGRQIELQRLTIQLPHPAKLFAEEFRSIPPIAA